MHLCQVERNELYRLQKKFKQQEQNPQLELFKNDKNELQITIRKSKD